ncbi:MAG: nucleotidyltransferase domain-containing protein [Candidatus Gracilibacteria bacterium]|nr:nucleotidyltransferase domain-containing protein [Candidatus Gracilibacteria bacterium]
MNNDTNTKVLVINTFQDLLVLLKNDLLEIRFYLSEKLLKDNIIPSITHLFNNNISTIIEGNDQESKGYSIQTLYIDGVKYYDIEKRNLINEREKEIVLNLLEEEFGDSLQSIGVFGSYITKEDGEYSDYDLVVMLNNYEDSNIYEREKASPRLKARLKKAGVQSLFAFNFTTVEELENANKKNPWLLETMGKSFYILKDSDNKLEDILTRDRGIEYLGNFVWKGESLNTKENLERIDDVLADYKNILVIATKNNNTDLITHYEWEIKKLEITRQLLEEQSLFVSRFDFDFICKELLELDENELNDLFQMYKKASIEGKKSIQSYNSIENNIDFSEQLKLNDLILPSLQHRYIALRNILSELLHKTGNFILDGEFTQKFLQVFGSSISEEVRNSFYENIFKTEQILGRTGYLSFDLNADGSYIFEEGNYDYQKLITVLDSLIQYFQENNTILINNVGQKETKISILSGSTDLSDSDFLFPNEFKLYNRQEVENGNLSQGLKDSEYIFVLDSENDFSPDYLLKILSGFNKKGIKCVSGNRASKVRGAKNKFHNFAFKKEDYEKDGKNIFKHSLRNVGATYFTS